LTPNVRLPTLAHFDYAKFLDSLFESRVLVSGDNRANAIRTIQECQENLIGSVKHYGLALQLGQKHVYQALPRLLALWLEFTSLEGRSGTEDGDKNSHIRQGKLDMILTFFLPKCIPDLRTYTSFPLFTMNLLPRQIICMQIKN
jgi:hypothetical protein